MDNGVWLYEIRIFATDETNVFRTLIHPHHIPKYNIHFITDAICIDLDLSVCTTLSFLLLFSFYFMPASQPRLPFASMFISKYQ